MSVTAAACLSVPDRKAVREQSDCVTAQEVSVDLCTSPVLVCTSHTCARACRHRGHVGCSAPFPCYSERLLLSPVSCTGGSQSALRLFTLLKPPRRPQGGVRGGTRCSRLEGAGSLVI